MGLGPLTLGLSCRSAPEPSAQEGLQSGHERSPSFLKKLKIGLPSDPVVPLQGFYPKKTKALIQQDYVHAYVPGSNIYNSHDMEATLASTDR